MAAGTPRPAGRDPGAAGAGGWRRVVLVGFMGSGKTTVGRLLAERLGWAFVDLDDHVEAGAGATVEALFATRGEDAFRALEQAAGRVALDRQRVVIAPGGGWAPARPGGLDGLPPGTLTVWLRVSPRVAVERARRGGRGRPLLEVEDPLARAHRLLGEREPVYRTAAIALDTDGASPAGLVDAIVEHMGRNA